MRGSKAFKLEFLLEDGENRQKTSDRKTMGLETEFAQFMYLICWFLTATFNNHETSSPLP